MRDAAFLLLALTTVAFVPAASAFAVGADAEPAVAARADLADAQATATGATAVDAAAMDATAMGAPDVDATALVPAPATADSLAGVPATGLGAAGDLQAAAVATVDLAGAGVAVQGEVRAAAAVDASASTDAGAASDPPLAPSHDGLGRALATAVAVPLAAVAVGAAASAFGLRAVQASLAAGAARLVRFLLGLAPFGLFSRIDRGQLLDNPVRARVHDAVAQDPGLTLSEVQARAGIAWGTTVHHLRRLESHGILVSITQKAHRRFFVSNTPAAAQRSAVSAIRHPTARRIADLVLERPGIEQSDVCEQLGLNGPSVSKHLGQFRGHGLIASERQGRRMLLHPTEGLRAVSRLLATPGAAAG